MSVKYLGCVEVAKLVRLALKESFPGVKFSVRSDGSINVSWIDGPNACQVESVAKKFAGSYFDGMIDYKGSIHHKLDGEEARLMADFVFCTRECSDALIERAIALAAAKYGIPIVSVEEWRHGNAWRLAGGDYSRFVRGLLNKISDRAQINHSPTLERLVISGDDGYGAGTVGRNGEGGEQCYAAMQAARERQSVIALAKQSAVLQ
jgi:hypothetical protein